PDRGRRRPGPLLGPARTRPAPRPRRSRPVSPGAVGGPVSFGRTADRSARPWRRGGGGRPRCGSIRMSRISSSERQKSMRGIKRLGAAAVGAGGRAAAGGGGGEKPIGSATNSSSPSSSTSSGGTGGGEHKQGGTVTIANVGGQTWPCQFNPFNPAVNQEANG